MSVASIENGSAEVHVVSLAGPTDSRQSPGWRGPLHAGPRRL